MLFVMAQAIRGGAASGAAALAGLQLGYLIWWLLAALGLGTLAAAFPLAFRLLAVAGAVYLGWLGLRALRGSDEPVGGDGDAISRKPSAYALRDGMVVALSNPKSLIYIVALLPPFVDQNAAVLPQLIVLWLLAMTIDIALGTLYIVAGQRLARAMTSADVRPWVDRIVGAIFVAIAIAILADQWSGSRR